MATATFIQQGDSIDYTPGAAVGAGDVVVLNDLIGVAKRDIPANTLGSLDVAGVFEFPKASGVGTAIGAGLDVFWDAGNTEATTDSGGGTNKKIGRSVLAADDDATTVRIRLSQ